MSAPVTPPPSLSATATAAERLVAAADAARLGMCDVDLAARTVLASSGLLQLLGLPATASLDAAGWLSRVHDDDRSVLAVALDRALRDDGAFVASCRVRHEDGGWRWLEAQGRATRDAAGGVRVAGVATDVTARRRGEEALRAGEARLREAAEEQLRQLVEQAPTLMFVTDAHGAVQLVNARWREYTGLAVAGRAEWERVVHPDDRDASWREWERALATGTRFEYALRLREGATGAWRWFLSQGMPLRDDAGRIVRWFGLLTDVHDQRAATERVATLQRVTAALGTAVDTEAVARVTVQEGLTALGATLGGLWLLDRPRGVLCRVWQIAGSEETRRAYAEIPLDAPTLTTAAARGGAMVLAEDPDTIRAAYPGIARLVDEEGMQAGAALPLVVDDRTIGALGLGFPTARQFSADERALFDALARQCALAVERTRLYDAERAAREEAEAARGAAEEARAVAESASRAKSEFLAVMSHELRTPLNAIAGHVELLEMGIHGPLAPSQREALERVTRAQRHLLALINDVLNLSRIESGRIEYDLEAVDVAELVASVAPLIEPQIAARQLAYEVHLSPPPLVVRADRDKLRQVMLNLLANAVKYTEPGGRVSVDAWTRRGAGPFGFVRVRDTGCGIPREKLEQVFEPFVRVDTGHTRRTDGAGLGLAIARDLARGMGGDLRARSVVGEGSSFTVALPLASG